MVIQELVNKELEYYLKQNKALKLTPYNKELINRLFKKFSNYSMTESSYCCDGIEHCCWQELIEEGNWGLTLKWVKYDILKNIKSIKKYLYNPKMNGNRFYMYEDEKCCRIYIYARDLYQQDYDIWFDNDRE